MKKGLLVVGLVVVMALGYTAYSKAHTVRNCRVIQECDKVVTVLHPNGEYYDFFTYDSNLYKEDTIIKVSFNELKLNKEDYTVNSGNPKEVLKAIEDVDKPVLNFKLPQAQVMTDPVTEIVGPDINPEVALNNNDINHPKLEFKLPRAVRFYYGSLLG